MGVIFKKSDDSGNAEARETEDATSNKRWLIALNAGTVDAVKQVLLEKEERHTTGLRRNLKSSSVSTTDRSHTLKVYGAAAFAQQGIKTFET